MADKTTKNKLPKYPEMPFKFENNSQTMSEEQLKAERLKAYISFRAFADNYKRQHKK